MKSILFLFYALFSLIGYTQLITYEAFPNALINSSFLGQDYVIFNVQYTGHTSAKGQFNATATNLGLTEGIVLTTGTIVGNQNGPIGPNNTSSGGLDNDILGNVLLTNIANEDTYNAAVLEFDFIPSVDSISLNYVFGSEEYPEFVDAGFNDVFGFFISGPGIVDTFNMATLPGYLNIPITIDNVNDSINSMLYVNNGNGDVAPQNGSDFYVQYDGFTTSLTAYADVLIGETYHLVIAIADVSDGAYDSGLFIEKCVTCAYEVGIIDKENNDLNIYPNPCNGLINIDVKKSFEKELTVYDVLGNVVKKITIHSEHTIVDINDLVNGVYYFTFSSGASSQFKKVIINK